MLAKQVEMGASQESSTGRERRLGVIGSIKVETVDNCFPFKHKEGFKKNNYLDFVSIYIYIYILTCTFLTVLMLCELRVAPVITYKTMINNKSCK